MSVRCAAQTGPTPGASAWRSGARSGHPDTTSAFRPCARAFALHNDEARGLAGSQKEWPMISRARWLTSLQPWRSDGVRFPRPVPRESPRRTVADGRRHSTPAARTPTALAALPGSWTADRMTPPQPQPATTPRTAPLAGVLHPRRAPSDLSWTAVMRCVARTRAGRSAVAPTPPSRPTPAPEHDRSGTCRRRATRR